MKDRAVDLLVNGTAVIAALVLIYFLTAPLVMNSSLGTAFPDAYQPVKAVLESYDYGWPLRWYFQSVWHVHVEYRSFIGFHPSYVPAIYLFVVTVLTVAVAIPFVRRLRRASKA